MYKYKHLLLKAGLFHSCRLRWLICGKACLLTALQYRMIRSKTSSKRSGHFTPLPTADPPVVSAKNLLPLVHNRQCALTPRVPPSIRNGEHPPNTQQAHQNGDQPSATQQSPSHVPSLMRRTQLASLIRSSQLATQTGRRPLGTPQRARAVVPVRREKCGPAPAVGRKRRCWRKASCGSAPGVGRCGTVGRSVRWRIGRHTRVRARLCGLHGDDGDNTHSD
jgi:hypothetical protein